MIFVPSKGRSEPGLSKTIVHLLNEKIEFKLVVEPQEKEAYQKSYPEANILVLSQSNQGIAFVRNFILKEARMLQLESFWMLDDDIRGMYKQINGKNQKSDFNTVLREAHLLFLSLPEIAQGALEYQQFSWSAKKDYVMNSYCDVAVWVHVKRTAHLHYRAHVNLKEDRDFTIQILASGFNTARASRLGFSVPKNGSNEGGLQEVYAQSGREIEAVQRMCALWPEFITLQTKSDGRVDCKINWKHFKK